MTHEPLRGGDRESLTGIVDSDWIPWWVLRTFWIRRRQIGELLGRPEYAHLRVIALARPADAERLLDSVRESGRLPRP